MQAKRVLKEKAVMELKAMLAARSMDTDTFKPDLIARLSAPNVSKMTRAANVSIYHTEQCMAGQLSPALMSCFHNAAGMESAPAETATRRCRKCMLWSSELLMFVPMCMSRVIVAMKASDLLLCPSVHCSTLL